jgi:hypothetical protein
MWMKEMNNLKEELMENGYGKDVITSVLAFTEKASEDIYGVKVGDQDEVLTLVDIDIEEKEEYGWRKLQNQIRSVLTFSDQSGNEFKIAVDTDEEWKEDEDDRGTYDFISNKTLAHFIGKI